MPTVVGKDEQIKKRLTCHNCGSINEYYPNEVRDIKHSWDYLGGYETAKGFNCAGCGKEIWEKR